MDRVITGRYAEALFELAEEKKAVEKYGEQVKAVLEVFSSEKGFGNVNLYD